MPKSKKTHPRVRRSAQKKKRYPAVSKKPPVVAKQPSINVTVHSNATGGGGATLNSGGYTHSNQSSSPSLFSQNQENNILSKFDILKKQIMRAHSKKELDPTNLFVGSEVHTPPPVSEPTPVAAAPATAATAEPPIIAAEPSMDAYIPATFRAEPKQTIQEKIQEIIVNRPITEPENKLVILPKAEKRKEAEKDEFPEFKFSFGHKIPREFLRTNRVNDWEKDKKQADKIISNSRKVTLKKKRIFENDGVLITERDANLSRSLLHKRKIPKSKGGQAPKRTKENSYDVMDYDEPEELM